MRPYGTVINDAIQRGDARRLESALNQAKQLHEKQGGDLSKAIKAGEAALKKLDKGAGGTSSGGGKKAAGGISSGGKKAPAKKAPVKRPYPGK
jgi:hypothetical protein